MCGIGERLRFSIVGWVIRGNEDTLIDDNLYAIITSQYRSCWHLLHGGKAVVEGEGTGGGPGGLMAVSSSRDGLGLTQGDGRQQLTQRGAALHPDSMDCWRDGDGDGRGHQREQLVVSQITH